MRMLTTTLLVLATGCSALAAEPKVESLGDRIEHVTFHSAALDREMAFSVVLPEGYDPKGKDWPALFFLHGLGRHERTLVEDEGTKAALLSAPFVTVLPKGRNCWYIDAPGIPEDRYEAYTEEVIALAQRMYRISKDRDHRGIGGWSAGGYGSARFAERHADQFKALATIIGLLDFPRNDHPDGKNFKVPMDRFTEDPQVWWQFNPMREVEALHDTAVLIVAGDRATDRLMNENFARRLDELSIPHEWQLLKGGHTFDVVREGVTLVVEFMTRQLGETP